VSIGGLVGRCERQNLHACGIAEGLVFVGVCVCVCVCVCVVCVC